MPLYFYIHVRKHIYIDIYSIAMPFAIKIYDCNADMAMN